MEVGGGETGRFERGPMDQLLGSVAESTTGRGVREKKSWDDVLLWPESSQARGIEGVETL